MTCKDFIKMHDEVPKHHKAKRRAILNYIRGCQCSIDPNERVSAGEALQTISQRQS
jgi:hypothetical protein